MRILGIDVGSTSIKAVEIDSAFGRYEIHDYHEHPVPSGEDLLLALSRLMQALPKQPDRVAIALRAGQVTFRNIKLPTRDRKTIQSSIGFELEDDLPFPLEKTVYDYATVSQSKQGTQVHVAATLKTHIAGTLDSWSSVGINPDLITTESWAYRTLLSRILSRAEQEEPILLVQIGHEHTTLYVHWNGMPVLAREIDWGGKDLTFAIAKKYNLPLDQAEQAKLDHGFVVPVGQKVDVTQEQLDFSETLLATLQTLLVEIRQVELTCKNLTHRGLNQIFVSGGTVLLPGLTRVLDESLRIPTRNIQALSSIATSGVTYSEHTDAVFLLAASVALSMVGADRSALINFRKGEFAKQGTKKELNIEMLRRPLMAAGAIAACMILSLAVQSSSYQARLADTNTQLERRMKDFFGGISASAIRNYMYNIPGLKNAINKELTKQRELAKLAAPNPHDPLDFLNTLSTSVPKSITTDLMQYQVGAAPGVPYNPDAPQSATLTFTVANQQQVDQLSSILTGKLVGFKKDKAEEVAASDGTRQIKVTFSGKPNYEAR
ncbi:MAG: pilus assembly protein PilM [Bdellovibrionia bacterium]